MKPTRQEIAQIASQMKSWFRMTDDEALDRANAFLVLAYGWGSPPTGATLEQKIKRDISKEFQWISDEARIAFEASEARRIAEQEIFISGSSHTSRFRL